MRFSVDAHAIGRHLTGNEVYVKNLLKGFAALDRRSEFIAYLSSDDAAAWVPGRFPFRRVAANPFLRLGCDLSRKLRQDRPDLVHVQYTAPLFCPVPCVVTVHDVSYLEHPEYFPSLRAMQLRTTVRRTVQRAVKILTVSNFSKRAIMKAYGLDGDRIAVVPNAAGPEFRPISRTQATSVVVSRFRLPAPFVLSVGDLQPRKNHVGLIRAFGRLLNAHPNLPHHLVLAGKHTWFAPRVCEAVRQSGYASRIHLPGFVSDDDLLHLYNACDLFVFPSFYEGFGLPVLEAMACGRAVTCSDTSAMPEVADGAAILFNPASTDEMVRAVADLLIDPELRARMERLGLMRASQFNWNTSAGKTLDVYCEVAGRRRAARARTTPAHTAR
jgi:glycosyltransferase involved in cell wall biosynthesis